MSHPVFARLSGFGWALVPFFPFLFERVPNRPRSVRAWHYAATGTRQATVSLNDKHPSVELGDETTRLEGVLDLVEAPALDDWRIETTVFSIRWPEFFAMQSSPEATAPGFDLHGPDGTLLYIQGPLSPARLPALTSMAGPGQTVRRHGHSPRWAWVELDYTHNGVPWQQTHRVVSLGSEQICVVTVQSPERLAGQVDIAAEEVASSLCPYRSE